MKTRILLLLLLITGFAQAQVTNRIQGDIIRMNQNGNAPAELQLENSTKGRTGAVLKNKGNGLTEFDYVVDDAWTTGDTLYLKKGPNLLKVRRSGINSTDTTSANGLPAIASGWWAQQQLAALPSQQDPYMVNGQLAGIDFKDANGNVYFRWLFDTTGNSKQYLEAIDYHDPLWLTGLGWSKILNHPTTIGGYGITDAFTQATADARYPLLSGSYANPAWLSSLAWSKLTGVPTSFTPSAHTHPWGTDVTGKPTTIAGYGITDAFTQTLADARYPQLSGSYTNPVWLSSFAWAKLTGLPTTIAGYGITDAFTQTLADSLYPLLSGSYANPSWISSLDWSKIINAPPSGNGSWPLIYSAPGDGNTAHVSNTGSDTIQVWNNDGILRMRLTQNGLLERYLRSGSEIGSIRDGTPGNLPGVLFYNGTGNGRTQWTQLGSSGGHAWWSTSGSGNIPTGETHNMTLNNSGNLWVKGNITGSSLIMAASATTSGILNGEIKWGADSKYHVGIDGDHTLLTSAPNGVATLPGSFLSVTGAYGYGLQFGGNVTVGGDGASGFSLFTNSTQRMNITQSGSIIFPGLAGGYGDRVAVVSAGGALMASTKKLGFSKQVYNSGAPEILIDQAAVEHFVLLGGTATGVSFPAVVDNVILNVTNTTASAISVNANQPQNHDQTLTSIPARTGMKFIRDGSFWRRVL
ncbi:hypothetical protein SAMN05444008_11574 [Cnuella takakiae]|uniref:Autotransporter-associated beta strand repeat-containing protein n=1 Tax=Cnuella takakiae TaxID=1302690 RepID=A0A1M5G3E7_9BACT|nr:hypothetical protein [Cnuella takakiae]OLY92308.1 hypothetical protein BUE76_10680 [Cnuella takakiae]SHF97952.1 hypothetical protein SAMN05444008_11574 [Cnuella takakiae]